MTVQQQTGSICPLMFGSGLQKRWHVRLGAQVITMLTATALLYASMVCLAGAALGLGHDHDDHGQVAEHHPHGPPDPASQNHHNGGAPDCCSSHLSTVPSPDPVIHKPHTEAQPHLILAVLMAVPTIAPSRSVLWEHGPPGESPPLLFAIIPQAPRAPPVAA